MLKTLYQKIELTKQLFQIIETEKIGKLLYQILQLPRQEQVQRGYRLQHQQLQQRPQVA